MNFEFIILDFIQAHFRCEFLDFLVPKISALGNRGILWIVFTLILLMMKKTRKYGLYSAISLILMLTVCNLGLKPLIARMRPFTHNTAVTLLIPPPSDYSFPSGHTMAGFATSVAYLMCHLSRKNAKEKTFFDSAAMVVIMFAVAAIIAFTRLYLYVHYPTDVLGAIILGNVDGIVSAKIAEKIIHTKNLKIE